MWLLLPVWVTTPPSMSFYSCQYEWLLLPVWVTTLARMSDYSCQYMWLLLPVWVTTLASMSNYSCQYVWLLLPVWLSTPPDLHSGLWGWLSRAQQSQPPQGHPARGQQHDDTQSKQQSIQQHFCHSSFWPLKVTLLKSPLRGLYRKMFSILLIMTFLVANFHI